MAAARKRIGILLYDRQEWTGGFYYVVNLIRSLQFLPDEKKPHLVFFYAGNEAVLPEDMQEIQYPYFSFLPMYVEPGRVKRIANKLMRMMHHNAPQFGAYTADTVEFIYPCLDFSQDGIFSILRYIPKIYWIPDFQDKYYPDFFSKTDVENKEYLKQLFIAKNVPLVFSSYNAADDFKKFYPYAKNNVKVVRFASILPYIEDLVKTEVYKKYTISTPYFISPNQFWAHKNHRIVIEAVQILVQRGIGVQVYFTGKEWNALAPEYAIEMKNKVRELNLEHYIHFLGFIDRKEQLLLMQHATAVVQPSLFEGWSTVVEDTKALGAKLIVSDLPVHREQCMENTLFFDPHNASDLAEKMEAELSNPVAITEISYDQHIRAFAGDFLNLNK